MAYTLHPKKRLNDLGTAGIFKSGSVTHLALMHKAGRPNSKKYRSVFPHSNRSADGNLSKSVINMFFYT